MRRLGSGPRARGRPGRLLRERRSPPPIRVRRSLARRPRSTDRADRQRAPTARRRPARSASSRVPPDWPCPGGSRSCLTAGDRHRARLPSRAAADARADGEAEVTGLGEIAEAAPEVEAGLLGVAVSPDFDGDTLFFYATTIEDNSVFGVTLDGDDLGEPTPILTGIPKGVIHDGGRLASAPTGSSTSPPARPVTRAWRRTPTRSPARSCASPPTVSPPPATPTRTPPSGRSATATSRASPSTRRDSCGPASSATRPSTSSTYQGRQLRLA